MNTPPKIMVDTGIVSIGWADPACWTEIDTNGPLANKLLVYRIKERNTPRGGVSLENLIAVQAIGRAARNGDILFYEYPELAWESWYGLQSWTPNLSPLYAFHSVRWHSVPSPLERSKFFRSDNWGKGDNVELFMDFLLKNDPRQLNDYVCRSDKFSDFERQSIKSLSLFQLMCDDKVIKRKRARDCYHLWACECSGLDFFLTTDSKLLESYSTAIKDKKIALSCKVVMPRGLVELLHISMEGISIPEPGKMFLMSGEEYIPKG